MKIEKVLNIMMGVLVAVSAVLVVSLISNLSDNTADSAMDAWLNTNLSWAYILLIACSLVSIVFSVVQSFSNKEAGKKGLVALGAAVVVFFISYGLASDAIPQFYGVEKFVADGTLTNTVSKWIDTVLIVTYILFGLAFCVTIFWSVARMFKK